MEHLMELCSLDIMGAKLVPERTVISHTLAGICVNEMKINDRVVGETEMNTLVAGGFNVPAIFISGDDAYVKEVQETLPRCKRCCYQTRC